MQLDQLPNLLMSSLVLGSIYTLVALGWVILFRATRVFNFAVGQFLLLGTYIVYWLSLSLQLPFVVSILVALAITALMGASVHRFLMRRLVGRNIFTPVILTMGLSMVISRSIALAMGTESRSLTLPFRIVFWHLPYRVVISNLDLMVVGGTAILVGGLLCYMRFTEWGLQMRAAAESPLLASQSGINIDRVFVSGWALSSMIAVIAGVAYSSSTVLSETTADVGLRGLTPALLGGFDSVIGVIPGGLVVALAENVAVLYLGGEVRDAAVFLLVLLVLLTRPYGLFGIQDVRRV